MPKKKIIKILIILFFIIMFFVVILLINNNQNENFNVNNNESIHDSDYAESFKLLKDNTTFYTILSNTNKYVQYCASKNKSAILGVLDNKYIDDNNITKNNVLDLYDNYIGTETLQLDKVYCYSNKGINNCIILGKILRSTFSESSTEEEQIEEFTCVMRLDTNNMTYSVYPCEFKNVEALKTSEFDKLDSEIKSNEYNTYKLAEVKNLQICQNYMSIYKSMIYKDVKMAYEKLNADYIEKRFDNSIDNYKKYLKSYNEIIRDVKVEKYSYQKNNEYTDYICVDQYNNYYIFRETSPMQYTIMLDNYTIPTKESIDKYNSSNNKKKSAMNVQTFIEMINNKDYESILLKLANSFKNSNSITENNCSKKIEEVFYNNNSIKSVTAEQNGNYYVVKTEIQNMKNKKEIKNITFVVNLKENTDFEISFSEDDE